jgi:hypothetical protein
MNISKLQFAESGQNTLISNKDTTQCVLIPP